MRGTRPTGRRCAAENALTEIMSHRILLVDEPTAQLDLRTSQTVNDTLGAVAQDGAIVLIALGSVLCATQLGRWRRLTL